jgi:Outer membrane protein beta-barrel domain
MPRQIELIVLEIEIREVLGWADQKQEYFMKSLFTLCALLFAVTASAANYTDMALEVGFRSQNGDVDGAGVSTNAQVGYQFGLTASFPVAEQWSIRSGLLYTQKNVEAEVLTTKQDLKFTYVEIPATALFKFADYGGVYAGLNISLNLDDDCGTTACTGVKSLTTPLVIGAQFKFAPQMGGSVYVESLSGEVADGVKNFTAVGANLMITFD